MGELLIPGYFGDNHSSPRQLEIEKNLSFWLDKAASKSLYLTGSESLTGGSVASLITAIPGSSRVFIGSSVSYSHDFKVGALGVQRDLISNQGAVDPEVAAQMALGAQLKGATYTGVSSDQVISFATTGVAGPTESDNKPVGLVYVALANQHGEVSVHEFEFSGDRNEIRTQATYATIELLMEQLPTSSS